MRPDDLRRAAYTLDPALWAERVVGFKPEPWQRDLLRQPKGSYTVVRTARQRGKTSTLATMIAHEMLFYPGSVSAIFSATQRQAQEAVRRVRDNLLATKERLAVDNAFSIELANGARVMAMPGADDASVRGLTITGVAAIDEAARVSDEIARAVRPMLARHQSTARFVAASTAWMKSGWFYEAWTDEQNGMTRIDACISDTDSGPYSEAFLRAERRALGEQAFRREYYGVWGSADAAVFTPDSIAALFHPAQPVVPDNMPPPGDGEDAIVHRAPAVGRMEHLFQ